MADESGISNADLGERLRLAAAIVRALGPLGDLDAPTIQSMVALIYLASIRLSPEPDWHWWPLYAYEGEGAASEEAVSEEDIAELEAFAAEFHTAYKKIVPDGWVEMQRAQMEWITLMHKRAPEEERTAAFDLFIECEMYVLEWLRSPPPRERLFS